MITRDELKHIFKLFRKHEDLLISSYLNNNGVIEEGSDTFHAIDDLINSRLAWCPADNEPVRITRELSGLFERVLRDPRRLTINADIGSFIINIENNVNHYKEALRNNSTNDINHYLSQIELLVDDLRSSLSDSSGHLWQKINSEFGYVTSLELKISENQSVLEQARRLNDSLELIKVSEFDDMAGNDPQLRRYLHRWLLDNVELCRKETVDAMYKLSGLLFEYREQEKLGRLVESFYHYYQLNPGYIPQNYTEMGEIPEVLNQVHPIILSSHADIEDPEQEVQLTNIISGLRKEVLTSENNESYENLEVAPDEDPVELEISQLRIAVDDFYIEALETNKTLSALNYFPGIDIEPIS